MAEARSAGALDRGWVPSFLPSSTTSIVESHNIDTNETWGTFRFATDITALPDATEATFAAQRLRRPPGVPDWPAVLDGETSLNRLRQAGLVVYQGSSPGLFVAVDFKTGKGVFGEPQARRELGLIG
jgi:hypothetical protein